MCRKQKNSSKVGDTLTATASAAVTKYEWSLNGTVVGATSTYTVPASATTGDIIAVTVTAEDGETATDSVIVSGLTITGVEPTTAAGTNGAGNLIGYKYVRIFFSEPLSSLEASEIEIRNAKSKQLYSLESVKLSSTGLFADVILYGSYDADGTTFLMPNTPYVATIDHDGLTDSLEFELPATTADEVVVAVDEDENMIYTQTSGRTQAIHQTAGVDQYYVGTSYEGDLGELLGRTVNFGYDGDGVLTDLTVQDEVVVIDTMKFVNGDGKATISKKDYFKTNDGTKYYFEDTTTATKNATNVLAASDATNKSNAADFVAFNPADGDVYDYARLVLNPTGTIATAVLNADNTDNIKVASVDDNVVIADKNTSMNFSGYTIFNNEELISTADLEEGDVVYYSIGDQFAYVYNETISGELDNVIHEKLDLNGTTYTWTNAKYYDDANDDYVTLAADTDAHSVASQKYLNSLDPDDVKLTLKMDGTIAYVDGEVVGESETTTTTYIITAATAQKTVAFDEIVKISANDGSDDATLQFNPYDLKSLNGEAGKTTGTVADTSFTFEPTDGAPTTIVLSPAAVWRYSEIIDVTTDNETGKIVGVKEVAPLNAAKTSGTPETIASTSSDDKINSSTKTVTTANGSYAVTASTKIWVVVNKTGDASAASVKMVKFSDFAQGTAAIGTKDADDAANAFAAYVYPDKANAKHIVIVQTYKDANPAAGKASKAWETGETAKTLGVVVGETFVAKSDGSDALVVKTITVQDATGTKITLDADGNVNTGVTAGDLVELTYTKSDLKVTKIDDSLTWATDTQWKTVAYDSGVIVLDSADELRPYSDCLILKHYTVGGDDIWETITIGEINSSKNGWNVEYHAVSTAGTKHTVDFVVVDEHPVDRRVVTTNSNLTNTLATLTTACNTLATNTDATANTTKRNAARDAKTAADEAIAAWEAFYEDDFTTSTDTTTEYAQYTADVGKITAFDDAVSELAAATVTVSCTPATLASTTGTGTLSTTGLGTGWTISYSSGDTAKATVTGTTVNGVATGTVTITATASKAGYVNDAGTVTITVP